MAFGKSTRNILEEDSPLPPKILVSLTSTVNTPLSVYWFFIVVCVPTMLADWLEFTNYVDL